MKKSLASISLILILMMIFSWVTPVLASQAPESNLANRAVATPFDRPHITVHITAAPMSVPAVGTTVHLTIKETNDGNTDLFNAGVLLKVQLLLALLDNTSMGFSSDLNNDGILNMGETWTWTIDGGTPVLPLVYSVRGQGSYGNQINVQFPDDGFDSVTITLAPSVPASADWGIVLLTLGLAAVLAWFVYRRWRPARV